MQSWHPNEHFGARHSERAQLYALQALALRLNHSFDQRAIMQQATEWVASRGMGAVIAELPGDAFEFTAACGLAPQTLAALQAARYALSEDNLPGYVALRRRAVLIADVDDETGFADLRRAAWLGGARAILALPLISGEQCAALLIFGESAHALDTATTSTLELLAGQIGLALDNARVVADLRRREQALEQRHAQLRRAYDLVAAERRTLAAVLDSAGDALLVTDSQGIVQLGNQALERVLGLHPDRLIGRALRHDALPPRLIALIERAQAGAARIEGEVAFPDGRVFHVNIAPVRLFERRVHAYVTLLKDVTYFKQLDSLKSQFVTTVSHDMKSPLNVITSYAELLELTGPLNKEQAGYVNRITLSARRLAALVSDLLDLARIEGHVGLHMAPCDIGALMCVAVDEQQLVADEKRIDMVIRSNGRTPPVWGDEGRIRQVFDNLIANALAYTPRDGAIWLSAEADAHVVTVRIEDSGIGIAPADMAHIFEPFFRTRPAQEADSRGTGLGLAIVKRIVEEHGGAIGVESAINGGSTFWFTLPIAAPGELRR